jgi:hypothetical protein
VTAVARTNKQIYAPYFGGADLIFANQRERKEARIAHKEWLSDRADGL